MLSQQVSSVRGVGRLCCLLATVALCTAWGARIAWANAPEAGAARADGATQRPAATRLLPRDTLLYVGTRSLPQLVSGFQETSIGRMIRDPELQPLLARLYGSAEEAAAEPLDNFGLKLDELRSLATGEVALALVPVAGERPALVMLIDYDTQSQAIDSLLGAADQLALQRGARAEAVKLGEREVTVFQLTGRRERTIVYQQRDGVLLMASSLAALRGINERWDSGAADEAALANHPEFARVARSAASKVEPHLVGYADPIELVRNFNPGGNASLALAFLPAIGLDGLLGIGGNMSLAQEQYDSVVELHLLLNSPRSGVLELLAFGAGQSEPESWVPEGVAQYGTLHLDAQKTYDKLGRLIDSFQGAGAFERQVMQWLGAALPVSLKDDLLPAMVGRYSYATVIEQPITITSEGRVLGIELRSGKEFAPTFERIVANFSDNLEKRVCAGVTYYVGPSLPGPRSPAAADPAAEVDPAAAEAARQQAERMRGCVCLLGDHLLMSDRVSLMELAIRTSADAKGSLAQSLDFKLIASRADRFAGEDGASMVNFNRPEEGLRMIYSLATDQRARDRLARAAEGNRFMQQVQQSLEDHPLPPFEVLAKYLAPSGAVLTDDATGLHYTMFTLRRSGQPKQSDGQ